MTARFRKAIALCALFQALASASGTASDTTNRLDWWSFKPIRPPAIPHVKHVGWVTNPIDSFVLGALEERGLAPTPKVDRRTLVRRLYFDLTGLPPSPDETSAFENDASADSYEKLVERLLASPRYGERWARHWLDVVRFAETHGFEMNQPRPNAWPYRDYVIRAFNEDQPYDRFVVEQIAGDVFRVDEATGFLVGGAWDQVKSPDPVLTANQRADELHDIVSVTGSTFLGLTVGCARCHNHKFDPISQTDYYAIKAVFEGVQHGERKRRAPDSEMGEKELAIQRARLADVESELETFEPLANPDNRMTNALRAVVNSRKNVERFAPVFARRLRFTIAKTTDAEPCIDELEVFTPGPSSRNVALATNGTRLSASGVYPNSDLHRLEHINDGRYGNAQSWISNERGKGWVELEFTEPTLIDKVVWGRDREQRYADRLALDYRIEVAAGSNDWRVVASSVDRRAYTSNSQRPSVSLNSLSDEQAATAQHLAAERAELEARVAALAKPSLVYGGTFSAKPEATYRLHRGDAMQKREAVTPGALGTLPIKFSTADIPHPRVSAPGTLTEDQQRRLAFAEWIVNPANPLTARVMVNRIWQYHFGRGLVNTPSDFGANGARPTHPELLDWLAVQFIAHGWSVKHVHRLIVTSATYRQASLGGQVSKVTEEKNADSQNSSLQIDSANQLLWHFPSRRLDAEAIRDSILAVSGKLDLKMGGAGFSFFEANDNYVRVYTPRREWPPETFRRMIYGTIVRQRPDGVFGAFDCPDAGQIAPKRNVSTTPLQALNLLNSTFIVQQANFFAKRLEKDAGADAEAQVRRAFALAFQRPPDSDELTAGERLVAAEGLPVFCRALFNANEFVYVF